MSNDFSMFDLHPQVLQAITDLGYEVPTPIQERAIPALLAGRDVLGQAQTGTGKTAAFALPLLHKLDNSVRGVQGLVVTPTRELALQVSKAVYEYGRLRGVRVLAVYGGQSYDRQISRLERGVDIVVGTPGRMLDLINRGVLNLSMVQYLVLDEADEMLSMGFVEDIEAILRETPSERQTALFSATLPEAIRQLAERYMHSPETISVNPERITVAETEQRHYLIYEEDKLAALMRLLEVETVTGALIFTRTKVRAAEVADALVARGIQAEALHGDLTQAARETVLNRFRQGRLTFLVATDVAARGLDIEGISHVINFDLPFDAEAYVHRIGRTGRAGRAGVAISLLTPREKQGLRRIEAYTLQSIHRGKLPGVEDVLAYRDTLFIQRVEAALAQKDNAATEMVERLCAAGHTPEELAAAAIQLVRAQERHRPIEPVNEIQPYLPAHRRPAATRETRAQDERPHGARSRESGKKRDREKGMVRFILNAGKAQGIRPGDIVGAIAGEADIPGRDIGAIDIQERHTFVDVAEKHADKVFKRMKQFRMRQHRLTLKYAE